MTIEQFSQLMMVLNVLTASVILVRGVFYVCNTMTCETRWTIRLSWVLMTTGALAVAVGPLFGLFISSVHVTLIMLGVAVFVWSDRRVATCGVKV